MGANPRLHNVANGQARLRRKLTLNSLASLDAYVLRRVFEKKVLEENPTQLDPTDYRSVALNNYEDEPTFSFKSMGYCAVLFSDYEDGTMAFSGQFSVDNSSSKKAQLAPYDLDIENMQERINHVPDWRVERNDYVCIFIGEEPVYYEVMDILNHTMVGNFGEQYVLAPRDILAVEPIETEYSNREET